MPHKTTGGRRKWENRWRDAWRKRNPERVQDYKLRGNYGITRAQAMEILRSQGDCCAVCLSPLSFTKPATAHVDHDHHTGAVRGVLCGDCNRLIGMSKDNPTVLRRAAGYVEREGLT